METCFWEFKSSLKWCSDDSELNLTWPVAASRWLRFQTSLCQSRTRCSSTSRHILNSHYMFRKLRLTASVSQAGIVIRFAVRDKAVGPHKQLGRGWPPWGSDHVRVGIAPSQVRSGRERRPRCCSPAETCLSMCWSKRNEHKHTESSHSRGQMSKQANGLDCLDSSPLVSYLGVLIQQLTSAVKFCPMLPSWVRVFF